MFWRQLCNELLKLFARKRTYIGFAAFPFIQILILFLLRLPKAQKAFSNVLAGGGYELKEYYSGLTMGVLLIIFTFALLGVLYLALVSGDIVAKESEEGSLRLILSRPISRIRLMAIKWLACLVYGVTLVFFIGFTSLLAGVIYRGGLGNLFVYSPPEHLFAVFDTREGLWRFCCSVAVLAAGYQVVVSLGFMFSCFNMKPAAATILTLSVMFMDFVLRNIPFFSAFQSWFIAHHAVAYIRIFNEVIPWWNIAESLLYLWAINLSLWIVGSAAFCSRDFKSG
ncbi:MAG: ABC transporter permease subunit [Verrucomicrobiae bacterium]|nr:ABC transporter permease subunit [Verrucomicrobiae bacterium]